MGAFHVIVEHKHHGR